MSINTFIKTCENAAQRGGSYIASQIREDGSLGAFILDYYKCVWALALTGYQSQASKLLSFIQKKAFVRPGVYHDGDEDKPYLNRSTTYRKVFIMMGALLTGRFDILNKKAIEHFLSLQNPDTGAFIGEREINYPARFNTNHSGLCTIFSVYLNKLDAARKAAEYLISHYENQPDLEHGFYTEFDSETGLITEYSDDQKIWYFVDFSDTDQHWFYIGMPIAALTHFYLFTSEKRYLNAAIRYYDLIERFPQGFENWPSSAKAAFGSARLYLATGEERFAKTAKSVAEGYLLSGMKEDGSYDDFILKMKNDKSGYIEPSLAITGEGTIWISDIARCLSARI